ncbi:MAG: aminotransferase class I/II-fold pyridoxal phosphate-dependent enzyme [Candidatus Riflebacteria bacterium]|nr:aminotransferase class I/II-fold pyridoxal phosphate-dependent enzyme [Candidatus Riflebacteria bacterium]
MSPFSGLSPSSSRRHDFRSDTGTRPTRRMRDAMRDAEVGDDVCEEDPTVNRLQELAARMIGKDASLFVPSGTFANQCAIGVLIRPGDEVIVSETAHLVEHEAGAAAALSGAHVRAVTPTRRSYLTAEDVAPRLRIFEDVHCPRTGLVVLENALSDGTVMPVEEMSRVRALAAAHRVPVHLDGARLFNAALALGVDVREICAQADTVAFCLSKGLGAPVGSLLSGTAEFVRQARRRRKIMGGGMRQAGVLAAPGIVALTDGLARLEEDHRLARLLARRLAGIPGVVLDLASVQTNMVYCHLRGQGKSEEELVRFLEQRHILVYPPSTWGIRFVTSLEVDEEGVEAAVGAVADYLTS